MGGQDHWELKKKKKSCSLAIGCMEQTGRDKEDLRTGVPGHVLDNHHLEGEHNG
jgi:hypothetical protein